MTALTYIVAGVIIYRVLYFLFRIGSSGAGYYNVSGGQQEGCLSERRL
jgi:hypothetical protein